MRKYGEIGRFTEEKVTYLVEMMKFENPFPFCDEVFIPWIAFYRTQKSSKHSKCAQNNKNAKACAIENKTWNPVVINKCYEIIKEYVAEVNPEYLSHSVYNEDFIPGCNMFEKRRAFYERMLSRIGYGLIYTDDSQDYFYETTYYYRKKEEIK